MGCLMAAQPLTLTEFRVDLQQMEEAIGVLKLQAGLIDSRVATITTLLRSVPASWSSPAELTFNEVQQVCTAQLTRLTGLLEEMISRMQTAYQNYLDAEQSNVSNLQH
jgi:WXG100 family type VII secretion target